MSQRNGESREERRGEGVGRLLSCYNNVVVGLLNSGERSVLVRAAIGWRLLVGLGLETKDAVEGMIFWEVVERV